MTPQEEATYLTHLLTCMARQPGGCNISEQGLALSRNEFSYLARRLQADNLAKQTNANFSLYLALTLEGQRVAKLPGGYADFMAERVAQTQQALQKEAEARLHTRLSTGATLVSALAAVVAIGVSVWLNNSLDKTNAQVEALTKRVQVLEAPMKQRQYPQRQQAQQIPRDGASLPAR